jgi:hypothetical protein
MGARTAVYALILMAGGVYFYINWRKNKMMLMNQQMTMMMNTDMNPATTYTPLIDMNPMGVDDGNPLPGGFPYNAAIATPHMDPHTGEAVAADDPFPRQMPDVVINFIANKLVQELQSSQNANLMSEESSTLYDLLMSSYYNQLAQIAIENDYRMSPLTDMALTDYSNLLLTVSQNHSIMISPSSRAIHKAQTYTSPPLAMGYGISGSFVALS